MLLRQIVLSLVLLGSAIAFCAENQPGIYPLPLDGSTLVGELTFDHTSHEDTLVDVAARNRVGYDALRAANPAIDAWLPGAGSRVTLPTRVLLPDAPHEGIVINVAEMRLYRFVTAEQNRVEIYAISVGRGEWQTPLTETKVVSRIEDPVWFPPAEIRAEHAARGEPLPMRVPPGPDNPLGKYVLTLDIPGYFIHGTNRKFGIGMQVTHGCIRMYPQDIAHLVHSVPNGTPVSIVTQRYKLGWHEGELYLEVYPALEGANNNLQAEWVALVSKANALLAGNAGVELDEDALARVYQEESGLPGRVSMSTTYARD